MNDNIDNESTFYHNSYGNVDKTFLGTLKSDAIIKAQTKTIDNDLKEYLNYLNEIAATWKDIQKTRALTSSELKNYNELLAVTSQINNYSKEKNKDAAEYVKLTQIYSNAIVKNEEMILNNRVKAGEITEKSLSKAAERVADIKDDMQDIKDKAKDFGKHVENSTNKLDALKSDLGKLSSDLSKLATVMGIDKITGELSGKDSSSLISIRNSLVGAGVVNNNEWNSFKNNLLSSTMNMNNSANKMMYNLDDVKGYMSNLSTLGIYDSKMAEAQLQAVIEGNKIAGLSYETQAGLLKLGRRSNNENILTDMNKTMASIMNTQVGISKEMLNELVSQNMGNADILTFLGNGNAAQQLAVGSAYLESIGGKGASAAATNIMSDMLANGVNSKYLPMFGPDILELAQRDAGRALVEIGKRVNSSQIIQAGKSSPYAANALGIDSNITALSGLQYSQSYDSFSKSIDSNTSSLSDMAKNQLVPWQEQMKNLTSLIWGSLDEGAMTVILNAFYLASIGYYALKTAADLKLLLDIKQIKGMLLGKTPNSIGSLPASMTTLLSTLAIIAGATMAIKDGVDGIKNPEKYGNDNTGVGKLKSGLAGAIYGDAEGGVGNAIKNGLKWGLIGAGAGTLIGGFPIGTIVGGLIGAFGGGTLGTIGANNSFAANAFGLVNSSKENTLGGPAGGYVGNIGSASSVGDWPWSVSSGYNQKRTYTNTKGQTITDVHKGIDLTKPNADGTPMGVNVAGTVVTKGIDGFGANYVVIQDGAGYKHQYWHMQSPSPLSEGQKVNAGQLVGLMGATGNVTGPHLHYGVIAPNGSYVDPTSFVTSNLFSPTKNGVTEETLKSDITTINQPREVDLPLVSSNTKNTSGVLDYYAKSFGGPGSNAEVVGSINGGFNNLIAKLDELSARQDKSEEMLRAIAIPSGSAMYKY